MSPISEDHSPPLQRTTGRVADHLCQTPGANSEAARCSRRRSSVAFELMGFETSDQGGRSGVHLPVNGPESLSGEMVD